ncbi:MAG: hypothetical protein IK002_10905 [Treponema sp.]|uniref:hypothetical protein n=1 Tax=Treponema sp. TaxID=166 RepID=UPI00298D7013|nr:hypothetical protein [Treponema sp.]MBR5934482.1 hypothetical protein [Treponema sp.]
MADFNKIKQQKLILECDKDTSVYFIDENKGTHERISENGEFVELYLLVISCYEPITDEGSVLTCSCGVPECAGFYNFNTQITDSEILWDINDGEDLLKFDKTQYRNEVKNCIEKLMNIRKEGSERTNTPNDYFYNPITMEQLELYYKVFTDEALTKNREKPRHKVIITPGDSGFLITSDGKRVSTNGKEIKFIDTDIFGQPLITWLDTNYILEKTKKKDKIKGNCNKENNLGIKVAKNLRASLPDVFDVWYQYKNANNDEIIQIKRE